MSIPSPPNAPRIGLAGIALESNAFAPVATEADFRARCYFEGQALLETLGRPASVLPTELCGFVAAMNATGPWEPVPLVVTACPPAGPVEQSFFEATVARIVAGIEQARAAGRPLDGVYLANHGAMLATGSDDADGDLLAAVRSALGAGAPLVATLDLHANLSPRMVEHADVLIGYQTNPHVDMWERGEEAAFTLRLLLSGVEARAAFVRLPLAPPSVTLLTGEGPYGELVDFAQRRRRELGGAILNATVLGGFVFGDSPRCGLSVVVTGRGDAGAARRLAHEIAERAWGARERFRKRLLPMGEAVAVAKELGADPARPPLVFSDAGDNPGGGGSGRTTAFLAALLEAAPRGLLYGAFHEPELARLAREAGPGALVEARFSSDPESARAPDGDARPPVVVPARVLAVSDGEVTGRRGIYAGRSLALGPTAALDLGPGSGVTVVVVSARLQCADPVFFEHLGLDPGGARSVVVKSRGHFRAGFDEWFPPERVVEVDTPGLTSPVLERFRWKGLPRPVYPLDEVERWEPGEFP